MSRKVPHAVSLHGSQPSVTGFGGHTPNAVRSTVCVQLAVLDIEASSVGDFDDAFCVEGGESGSGADTGCGFGGLINGSERWGFQLVTVLPLHEQDSR